MANLIIQSTNNSYLKKEDLQKIRDYRNTIHSFKDREIGFWNELNEFSKLILLLVIEMTSQLPDIPDEVPIESWYLEEKTKFIMQVKEWFDFKIGISK